MVEFKKEMFIEENEQKQEMIKQKLREIKELEEDIKSNKKIMMIIEKREKSL